MESQNWSQDRELYAWVAEDSDDSEGIVVVNLPGVGWVPAIGADRARIENYREQAQVVAHNAGCPVRLEVFRAGITIKEA